MTPETWLALGLLLLTLAAMGPSRILKGRPIRLGVGLAGGLCLLASAIGLMG